MASFRKLMTRGASSNSVNGKKAFQKKYNLGDKLGSGQFADVFLATLKANTKEVYAVKIIKKSKLTTKADKEGLEMEISILQEIDFHGIIKLYDVYEAQAEWYLVTELAKGGELFDRIVEKTKDGAYSEKEAALIVMQIAESLKYCHDMNVVHRDLKPENLLLESDEGNAKVKLADFGFAAYCQKPLNDGCGTLVYVAPEILRGDEYKTKPDMWSLGVIAYILLCGYPPFFHTSQEELSRKIVRGRYRFRPEDWERVSNDAKDFIRGLLKRDPDKRMSAQDVLNHPWITNYGSLSNSGLDINQNLRQFQAEMLLKRAMLAIKAVHNMKALLAGFDESAPAADDAENVEGV